ncbi:MAG: argininosuccinate synthase [Methanomicrobiaceae archaeon]|nr:argininosuccinate synthase [Methanomicrobiaceae archaeon]
MTKKGILTAIYLLLLLCLVGLAQAAPTPEVHVMKYAPDGETIVNETTVDYRWMEANLPVQGDGVAHYYHQGPVFSDDPEVRWDVNETTNFKDRGAVMGTDIKDLCDLVGGAEPGDEIMIRAVDGYHVEFPYENVYEPQPRQGPIVLAWYNGEDAEVGERQGTGYVPDFYAGMRLIFFADTSTNADGLHVFGNNDMRETMPGEAVHFYSDLYPSTNGLSVKWADEVRIYPGGYQGERGTLITPTGSSGHTDLSLAPLLVITGIIGGIFLLRRNE